MASVETAWNFIKDTIGLAIDTILDTVTGFMQIITGDWEGLEETIIGIWTRIGDFTTETWIKVRDAIIGFADEIATALETKAAEIATGVETWWNDIVASISSAITTGIADFTKKWNDFKLDLAALWLGIKTSVKEWWDNIIQTITTFIDDGITGWTTTWDNFKLMLSTLWMNIWTSVFDWWQSIRDTISEKIQSAYNAVIAWVGSIKTGIENIWNEIKAWLEDFSLYDTATAIIQTIVDAVLDGASSVINSFVGMLKEAVRKAKEALGISSPSTVFRDEIMGNVMAGIVEGARRAQPTVEMAFANLLQPGGAQQPAYATSQAAAGMTSITHGGASITFTGPISLGNDMSMAQFEATLRDVIRSA